MSENLHNSAQALFAQVREALDSVVDEFTGFPAVAQDALSAIERHVQDMETALECEHHETAWTFIEYEGESWNACQDCGLLEKWAGGQRFAQRVDPAALPASGTRNRVAREKDTNADNRPDCPECGGPMERGRCRYGHDWPVRKDRPMGSPVDDHGEGTTLDNPVLYQREAHPVDDALDRLRQQINKSRATYVPGTPEKYPATELRGLTVLEAEALLAQAERLTEGLREKDEIIDCLLQRGHFDPFVPLAAFRKIVPKGAYSVTTADEERAWLTKIEARALLSASPPQGDAAEGSSPSDGTWENPGPEGLIEERGPLDGGCEHEWVREHGSDGHWCVLCGAGPSDGGGAK